MEDKSAVMQFIDNLGKLDPPKINFDLVKAYVTDIVTDSKSLEEFIIYSDQYIKHTRTFQLAFLLHSLSSILDAPIDPIEQVKKNVSTDAFDISPFEVQELQELEGSKRYAGLCNLLMDFESDESQSLEGQMKEQRSKPYEKFDDGSEPYEIFDPMKTNFEKREEIGSDLTEELEIKD